MRLSPCSTLVAALSLCACHDGGSGSISSGLGTEPDQNGAHVRLAMNGSGYGFATWESNDGSRTDIALNSYVPLVGWGLIEFPDNGGGEARDPDVAMGRYSQDAMIVWAQEQGGSAGIYAARWNGERNAWDPVHQIASYGGRSFAFTPRVAYDGDRNAVAVWTCKWYEGDDPHFAVHASRYQVTVEGAEWSAPERIDGAEQDGMDAFDAQVAMNDSGFAIATMLYGAPQSSDYSLHAALLQGSFDGGAPTWSEPLRVNNANDNVIAGSQRLALNAMGQAAIAWTQGSGDSRYAYVNRYEPGEGLRGWQRMRVGSGSSFAPDVGADYYGGTFLMVWAEDDPELGHAVYARRYRPDEWQAPETIVTSTAAMSELCVAVAEDGSANVVWLQTDGSAQNLLGSRYQVEQGWDAAAPVEQDDGAAAAPVLGSDFAGRCLVAWERSDGTHTDIWANDYTPGTGWGSPSFR